MRVSTISTMTCPRCGAPVKGDYKYCPECACRLRTSVREADPEAAGRGPLVLVSTGILLVLAGILVGWKILAGGGENTVVIVDPPRKVLRWRDIPESLISLERGISRYDRNENVLWEPPADTLETLIRSVPLAEREALLASLEEEPGQLARYAKLLAFFYDRSESEYILRKRTRQEPVWVEAFKCMRYEVTRGQYKDFLDAVQANPALLSRWPWVRRLWRAVALHVPMPADASELQREKIEERRDFERRRAHFLAIRYRQDWWLAVLDHHKRRDNARRAALMAEAVADGRVVVPNADELMDYELARAIREEGDRMFPPAAAPPRPAFLGSAAPDVSVKELARLTDADAVLLLVPPAWVRFDERNGSMLWGIAERDDDLPITDVCWWDAQMFAHWAQQVTGINTLRLPNWGEWTRAFHGGRAHRDPDDFNPKGEDGRSWPWGNLVDLQGCNNLNHVLNKDGTILRDVRETYSWHGGRSADGLLSMAGNAAEWTNNTHGDIDVDEHGTLSVIGLEVDKDDRERAFACGGSFRDGLDDCRVSESSGSGRRTLYKTIRDASVGFRLVTSGGGF